VADICFFATVSVEFENAYVWIANDKDGLKIYDSYLFSSTNGFTERLMVDNSLRIHCQPLTIVQHTGDWFLMRKMRITGTMSSSLPNVEGLTSNEQKQFLLDHFNHSHHSCAQKSTDNMQ
jgi:hypothetical protein